MTRLAWVSTWWHRTTLFPNAEPLWPRAMARRTSTPNLSAWTVAFERLS
jgi:hypothetical protein